VYKSVHGDGTICPRAMEQDGAFEGSMSGPSGQIDTLRLSTAERLIDAWRSHGYVAVWVRDDLRCVPVREGDPVRGGPLFLLESDEASDAVLASLRRGWSY
jgi:hypothetical protein